MDCLVDLVAQVIPSKCQVRRCDWDGCSLLINGDIDKYVLINVDCGALGIPRDQPRCDYILVAKVGKFHWVAPIELKSGWFNGQHVVRQLRSGASIADRWLPPGVAFQFIPILAHKRDFIHPVDLEALRVEKIVLRDSGMQTVLASCGTRVSEVLCKSHVQGT